MLDSSVLKVEVERLACPSLCSLNFITFTDFSIQSLNLESSSTIFNDCIRSNSEKMNVADVGLWLLLLVLFVVAYWYLTRPNNLPPGPAGLPLVGSLLSLGSFLHLTLLKIGEKHGNIFHMYLGSRLVVVLNDYTAIREAFVKNAEIFSGRPRDNNFREKEDDNVGIAATEGEYWKLHRRFILTNLRDYGVGKLTLEPLLLNELHYCLNEIKKHNGESFPIKQLLSSSVANNIHILVTGKRYDYDHPTMVELFKIFRRVEAEFPPMNWLMFFPWMAYVPGNERFVKRKVVRKLVADLGVVIEDILKNVKEEYKEGQRDNYVQAYLTERAARKRVNDKDNFFHDLGLLHITRDLLIAGTETTSAFLHWSLLYITIHQDIQKKVQTEIDRVIGPDREPSYNDRTNMPYTEATIMELHRAISLTPLSNAHRNTREVDILGYTIPQDTMIIPNLWAVHHDPSIWGDPDNFRPERFLTNDGQQVINSEHLIPFSIGKRACAGEPLARMEIFLYFVSLLQNFEFLPPNGVMPNLEARPGSARRPKEQLICAKIRNS